MRKLFFTWFMVLSIAGFADERRALKLLERKDFDKLVEVLEKDIEKDSLNPGAYYIYSLLYNDPVFEKHNIDTAYRYVLRARSMIRKVDERDREKLGKLNISDSIINLHKSRLEYLAYEKARSQHTIEGFNFYIRYYKESKYRPDALADRNELAFHQTDQDNTYQAYYEFIEQYPDAVQVDEARKRYERLLYETQTSHEDLESYEDFIAKFPDSPFKDEAINVIYRIKTSDNMPGSLLDFINEFPASMQVKEAIDRLYYNYLESGKTDFSYQYSILPLDDSIKRANAYYDQFLIPVYENGLYGFITSRGEAVIPYEYTGIDTDYLCGDIHDDFLVVTKNEKHRIISKTGYQIYGGPFYNVEDLGYGLLKISNNGRYGLVFKTGKTILPIKYDEIVLLDNQLLKIRQADFWQLYSLNGQLVLSSNFMDVQSEGNFLLLKKDHEWAVTNNSEVFSYYMKGSGKFNYQYDDYELIEENQLLCFSKGRETVVGKDLDRMIPLDDQRIFALPEGWLVKRDSAYDIYDDIFFKISGSGFEKVEYKGKWITGKTGNKWILYHNFAPFPDVFAYDSINILSARFVLVFEAGSPSVIFTNLKKENLTEYQKVRILKYSVPTGGDDPYVPEFLFVEYPNNRNVVYNPAGDIILRGDFSGVQALGPEYLRIVRRGKEGLADTSGHILLKPQFDGIANYQQGYVSLLGNKKFGIYNRKRNIYLKPDYDRLLKIYNDSYLIAYHDEGYGLISNSGEKATDLEFEDIAYWNDSSMLVMEDGLWHLFDINSEEYVIEDILDFQYLKNDDFEKIMLFTSEGNYGITSNTKGYIINPSFNDIIDLGDAEQPVYFAEKYIPEAEFYIVIYYDGQGGILRKQVFTAEEYEKIYCN